jgi:hypothetical protein
VEHSCYPLKQVSEEPPLGVPQERAFALQAPKLRNKVRTMTSESESRFMASYL